MKPPLKVWAGHELPSSGEINGIAPPPNTSTLSYTTLFRSDQQSDAAADRRGPTLFFWCGSVEGSIGEAAMAIHKVVVGERADDPIAPAATGTELIIATTADRA